MSTETITEPVAPPEPKLSPVEKIKAEGHFLRGTIAEEFADPNLDHLSEPNKQLIKFHGSYQQEDRDARKRRDKPGVGKAYMFMVRLKLPGGKLTADQYLTMDDLTGRYANGTLRVTTRQSFQFHGILKPNMKPLLQGINESLVTTLGGCGDVTRNVICCPAPLNDPVRLRMQQLTSAVAAHLAPRAGARSYHEIWLNGEPLQVPAAEHANPEKYEPIYKDVYLPRKFKVGFALPEDNCTDVLAQCLGFLAVRENGRLAGFNLYAGGGQGQTNGNPETFPYLGQPVCFVEPDDVVWAAEGICKLFRDHGNRVNRKRARLKYVMYDWGAEQFREVFARDYFRKPVQLPRDVPITGLDLHHGWQPQGDGKWFLGLSVENGRIKDDGSLRLRSGLRAIVSKHRCNVRLTTQQDVLLCDIATSDRPAIDSLLNEYSIPRPEGLGLVKKWSMACPAIPTCGLAITEAERALPAVTDQLDAVMAELGLSQEAISVRMTGCPNGCARPYQSEVGLVGRGGTKYTVYIGGDTFGRRLNTELQDSVPVEQIVPKLRTIFTAFKAERIGAEPFGDYCTRVGIDRLKGLVGSTK
jgi:sulfite reductase (ferredoxin)